MNCHECIYSKPIPGNAHIECNVDWINKANAMLIWLHTEDHDLIIKSYNGSFEVEISRAGIKGGWAYWPINFDPIWIKRCTRFKPKGKKTTSV